MKFSLLVPFVTIGLALPITAAPTITTGGIVNASGYQAKLAPGTVFLIFGAEMGPAALVTAPAPNYPTELSGTSITFSPVVVGQPIQAKIVYTSATQVASFLPSSIAPGTYEVRVSYNGQPSSPQNVTVVARSLGIAAANGFNNGVAQATIGNVNGGISLVRLTTGNLSSGGRNWVLTPSHPGDSVVVWGTGGGADSANDTGGTSGDQTATGNFKVTIGTRAITPFYAGTSPGYPGLWQVNFTLPSDIDLNCFAPLQVSAGGEMSNIVTIAIAAAGQSSCSNPDFGAPLLASLDSGGSAFRGSFTLAKETTPTGTVETANGSFARYDVTGIAELYSGIKLGGCTIFQKTATSNLLRIGIPIYFYDAGASLPISGPGLLGNLEMARTLDRQYNVTLGSPNTTTAGGTYTLRGNGGVDIGSFTASLTTPTDFAVTNFNGITSINRNSPVTVNWTGGGSGLVQVVINSQTTVSGTPNTASAVLKATNIYCEAPASGGTLTVPANVLAYLLPATNQVASGTSGKFAVYAMADPAKSKFTAPFVVGVGQVEPTFMYSVGVAKNLSIQ